MEGWQIATIPVSFAVLFGFIAWVIGKTRQEIAATRAREQIHTKMVDKFSASDEFVKFMQTPEGAKYLESFTERPKSRPIDKIIGAARTGVIVVMISLGFILVGALTSGGSPVVENPPFIIGLLGLFLGVGFLGSGLVSHRLSKAFGLLNGERGDADASRE